MWNDSADPGADAPPWLMQVVQDAAPVRGERVLFLGAVMHAVVVAAQHAVGAVGSVTITADRAQPNGASDEIPPGRFDLALALPLVPQGDDWVGMVHGACHALRPGGRMVLDLPATCWSDDLARAAPRAPGESVMPRGVDERTLTNAARALRLRNVQVTARTCLHRVDGPDDLIDLLAAARPRPGPLDLEAARLASAEVLARRNRATRGAAPLETVLRRVRLEARR